MEEQENIRTSDI